MVSRISQRERREARHNEQVFSKTRIVSSPWHQKSVIRSHIAEGGPSHSEGRTLQNYRAQEKDEKRSLMQSLCVSDKGRGRGNAKRGEGVLPVPSQPEDASVTMTAAVS